MHHADYFNPIPSGKIEDEVVLKTFYRKVSQTVQFGNAGVVAGTASRRLGQPTAGLFDGCKIALCEVHAIPLAEICKLFE